MSQIAGGRMAGGMGVRGPGETALEMDRRTLRRRMTQIRHSLVEVEKRRTLERTERAGSGLRLVGLVGYTNAGKSSLLNALAGATVVSAHDRLFETLDTTIRRVDLGERTEALLSDTVGFLDDLPHSLIAAFRATLEETVQADLLVEVLDASDPEFERQHHTVEDVLGELGVQDKPRLLVLNKWDLVPADHRAQLQTLFPGAIPISATTGSGLGELRDELRRALGEEMVPLTLRIPYNRMALLQFAPGQGRVVHADYEYEYVQAKVRVLPRLVEQLQRYVVP
jgi:GTP-binding protein HflX